MDYQSAVQFFGGSQTKLAAALGISQPTVSRWGGIVPAQYQFQIEVLSGRTLRVDPALIAKVKADAALIAKVIADAEMQT